MKNVITALLLCISIGASAQTMGNPMPNVSAEDNPLQTINNTPGPLRHLPHMGLHRRQPV